MMTKSKIKITESDNSVMRLLKYKIMLKRLKNLGLVKVFSDNLADSISISSSLVRKDFSLYGISGNKRGGYNIDEIIEKLDSILGKDKILKVVIAGAGKLGMALLHYKGFKEEHIKICAAFDNNPGKLNKDALVPVLPIEQLIAYVQENNIKIGILTLPDEAAQRAADLMILGGIKGILNFSQLQLRVPEHCIVNNINLELELGSLIHFVNKMEKKAGND